VRLLVDAHCLIWAQLAKHHRDPFDRLIVAQAEMEAVQVVSADAVFDLYGVGRVWN